MSDFNLEGIKNFIDSKKSKFIDLIKKTITWLLGIAAGVNIILSLIFFSIKVLPIAIFFIGISGGLLLLMFLVSKIPDFSKRHYVSKEIKECENLLNEIKGYINNNESLKNEFKTIIKDLNDGLKQAKDIASKIYNIEKTLQKKDWNILLIEKKIKQEETKPNKNEIDIKKLIEQKDNIKKLTDLQNNLISQLSSIKHTFNSVYTKLTLLDTSKKADFDSVETEIKKVLDFKLKVTEYEKELDKELKF